MGPTYRAIGTLDPIRGAPGHLTIDTSVGFRAADTAAAEAPKRQAWMAQLGHAESAAT